MLLTKVNQKVAPALALPDWQRHNAANVVVLWAHFLLAEVSNKSSTVVINFSHNIEEEGLDIIKQGFMVEEHLGEQAEVLAVDLE